MLDERNNPKPGGHILGTLEAIGTTLAEGVKRDPRLSALVLIVLIAAVVAIKLGTGQALNTFLLVAVAVVTGIIIISCLGIKSQKDEIERYAKAEVNMGHNTVGLVDELSDSEKHAIRKALQGAAEDVAEALKLPVGVVRSNLFGVDGYDRMRMLPELTFQMDREGELTISMPVGYGSTGRCFQSGKPNIAVFREDWGKDVIGDTELRKAHPDLQWIISVPVLLGGQERRPTWVLNVDGLRERRGRNDLQSGLRHLFVWSEMLSLIVAKALERARRGQ